MDHSIDRRSLLLAAATAPAWTTPRTLYAKPTPDTGKSAAMLLHKRVPHNAEPQLQHLVENWITPLEHFYVRSHAPVPQIDLERFTLSIEGLIERPQQLTLAEIRQQFPQQEITATLTCAGNRRSEHSLKKQVDGVPWQAGAIGNARWSGPTLSAVLRHVGLKSGARHVWFEALDEVERPGGVIPFGASIPINKVLDTQSKDPPVLLAHSMNGAPLTPDHGFPLRTIVPGYIGARSVKWLGRIVVSDRPSPNHYVATAYKLVERDEPEQWSAAAPLGEFAINSVICLTSAGHPANAGRLKVQGYALPPGTAGCSIARVQLSADEGHSWSPAQFTEPSQPYCWRLWKANVKVGPQTRSIIARATDNTGQTQPQQVAWNLKGYQFNAWHRVALENGE